MTNTPAPPSADAEVTFHHPAFGHMPGYYVGRCGHRVAGSEWRAGFRVCERCDPADHPDPVPASWAVPE